MATRRRVVVVGAGASGLASAICAARAGADVLVMEATAKVGRSILASGNGRCNFANADLAPVHYNNPSFVGAVMGDDPLSRVLDFFDGLGLWSCVDAQGRLFPRSRAATSVLDVLLAEIDALGVTVRTSQRVEGLQARLGAGDPKAARWSVIPEKGRPVEADAVIWAAGGGSSKVPCAEIGIAGVPESAVLCPLATKRGPVKGLDGVRVQCEVSLSSQGSVVSRQSGEVLFRPYGVSGIVIFDLSRFASTGDMLYLNFMPGFSLDRLVEQLERRLERRPRARTNPQARLDFLSGALHPALGQRCMELHCGEKGEGEVNPERLARLILEFPLKVKGTADETHGQVMRGGLVVDGFDTKTLECHASPGFYACGEALDVDGACGGYNLAWAWCSGMTAGRAAASPSVPRGDEA